MIPLAIVAGLFAIAAVLYVLGSRWLALQERELGPEEPESDEAFVELLRKGPREQATLERAAWEQEQRAEGKSKEQIENLLDERPPILFI